MSPSPRCLSFALLLLLALTSPALSQACLYVAPDGDDVTGDGTLALPFATIQHALDLAVPGDEVCLLPGVYTGDGNRDLDFAGKAVVLRSSTGLAADVTIDCQGTAAAPHRLVTFAAGEGSGTVIRGITVTGGYSATWGGAVQIDQLGSGSGLISVRLVDCVFAGNTAVDGGGALNVGEGFEIGSPLHRPSVEGCRFTANTAGKGGAISAGMQMSLDLEDSRFWANSAENGGAVYFHWESRSDIQDCEFRENTATEHGGGVVSQFEQYNEFVRCRFVGNQASLDGGGFYNPLGNSIITNGGGKPRSEDQFVSCDFDSNTARCGGGAFLSHWGWWVFDDCRFRWNSASVSGGGVITRISHDTYIRCLFDGNTAPAGAGLMWCGDLDPMPFSPTRILQSTFVGNTGGAAIGMEMAGNWQPVIDHTIVAFNGGPAFALGDHLALPDVASVNSFGNAGGDWPAPLDGLVGIQRNFSADPLFCDRAGGQVTILDASPCAPGMHPEGGGDLIGRGEVGCEQAPVLVSLTDVPADDGGQLRLVWNASHFDQAGSTAPIIGYGVYRHAPMGGEPAPGQPQRLVDWDYITTVPARGDAAYQVVAPTLCDSTDVGMCMTTFMISAMTADPVVFFDSAPDSGYSVDNLAPGVPPNLMVTYDYADGHVLTWDDLELDDLRHYRIYRGTSPDFVPTEDNLVGLSAINTWADDATGAGLHYRVSAMDQAGNEGEAALPGTLTSAGLPAGTTRFLGASPNPFNPRTTFSYELAKAGVVTLRVYDLTGRLVDAPLRGSIQRAGRHAVTWEATDRHGRGLAAGRYLAVFEAGGGRQTVGVTLLK